MDCSEGMLRLARERDPLTRYTKGEDRRRRRVSWIAVLTPALLPMPECSLTHSAPHAHALVIAPPLLQAMCGTCAACRTDTTTP